MVKDLLAPFGWNEDAEPLCLAFANTVGARGSPQPNEYLRTPVEFGRFVERSGLGAHAVDDEVHVQGLRLRDAIYQVFSAVAAGKAPPTAGLDIVNRHLHEALSQVVLGVHGWALEARAESQRFLMLAALSAAELTTSDRAARVRECADPECGWLFIDASKNRSRRWCSMSDCGNLAKARRFQAKKRGQLSS